MMMIIKKTKTREAAAAKPKEEEEKVVESPKVKQRKEKVWLNKGLYAGQEGKNLDWFSGKSDKEKASSNLPEYKPNGLLPLPMWKGQRLLQLGRDFKLPFDVCSPLPPGQPLLGPGSEGRLGPLRVVKSGRRW